MKIYIAFILLVAVAGGCVQPSGKITSQSDVSNFTSVKIANWNLQIFGQSKAGNADLMSQYAKVISNYDIVFVQEIRDSSQTAFPKLCSMLPDYNCNVSSRAGRTSSKEQYGVLYKKNIEIKNWTDFNPDSQDRWERPPLEVVFWLGNYSITIYNIHTKPDDAKNEISNLEHVVSDNGNVIVIGDLNADCDYYDNKETEFDSWNWVIKDSDDTTVGPSDCAYDRIILNQNAYKNYVSYGIYTKNITKEDSDHYPVWVEFRY